MENSAGCFVNPLSFLHNHLRALAFAGVEDDGLMRGGSVWRGATTMGVAMEVEFALPKLGPQQTNRSQSHDEQRNHGLPIPIHASNIGVRIALAIGFSG